MVVTLTGANLFAIREALEGIIAPFTVEHGDIAIERLDGEQTDIVRIRASLQSPPFLSARKMVVIRNAGTNKQFVESAATLLGDMPATTDLIMVEPKLDKRSVHYKYLKQATEFHDLEELNAASLARWVNETVSAQGGTITASDAQLLIGRVGDSQQLLLHAIEKLTLYSSHIDRQSIELLTDQTPQGQVFQLLEAAFGGQRQQAIRLYQEQREQKVDPLQIIAMLTWQLRVLALIQSAGNRPADVIATQAKLSPFVVHKSYGLARTLSRGRLRQLVSGLLALDVRAKREPVDLDEALQNYLLTLSMQ